MKAPRAHWAYVLTYHEGEPLPFYERSFPADCIDQAMHWLRASKHRGFICIDCLPGNYWR